MRFLVAILMMWAAPTLAETPPAFDLAAAVAASPDAPVHVPPGDHIIDAPLRFSGTGGGLHGSGRIVQTDPSAPVVDVDSATDITIDGVTLTRAEGAQEATAPGLLIRGARHVRVRGVRVLDNHARDAAIDIRDSTFCSVRDCEVRNYKRIAIDDRTDSDLYGYAFRAIDGTGIMVRDSTRIFLTDNQIVEERLLPTREAKERHGLGELTEPPETRGALMPQSAWDDNYVSNWHQGSAIVVTGPRRSAYVTVARNYLENAAQGIDLHADFVQCTDNTVFNGLIGVKLTHGCRNAIVADNLLTRIDLWGILLNPGAASGPAREATEEAEALEANLDAGTIIRGNLITDFGYGHEYWNWGGNSDDQASSYAIALLRPQLVGENPPLRDVLITGNMVYDAGKDGVLVDGKVANPKPRYRFALYVEPWKNEEGRIARPERIRVENNHFNPGTWGIMNVDPERIAP